MKVVSEESIVHQHRTKGVLVLSVQTGRQGDRQALDRQALDKLRVERMGENKSVGL